MGLEASGGGEALEAICGWGRSRVVLARVRRSEDLEQSTRKAVLTRGLGRSYGDAALPAQAGALVAASPPADRILHFDPESGVLRAEAGLSLAEIKRLFLPRGWFPPVSPGTQFVTLGGMVAADVHGKNHHREGSFGDHVEQLRMRLANEEIVECSGSAERELFDATIGGFGLTGHVLEVEFRLQRVPSPWIVQQVERAPALDALLQRLREASCDWPYTVAWADCLAPGAAFGRGLVISGRWAQPSEAPARAPAGRRSWPLPFECPGWLLGRWSGRAFNAIYHRLAHRRDGLVQPDAFFYPLDVLHDWNRLFGRRGFTQYQCVLPHSDGNELLRGFLRRYVELRGVALLCVIKDLGAEGRGMISFPKPGFAISLDVPLRTPGTPELVDGLNAFVAEHGGRVYLAKDALSRPEHFRAMEPRLEAWNQVRRRWDPENRLKSALSVRLLGDTP